MPDQKNQDQLREFITALIAFQKQMPVIPKNKTASVSVKGGGSYTYNYADLGDIIPVVMPLLGEHGLVHTCTSHRTTEGFILTGHLMHQAGHIMTADLPLFGTRFQEIGGSITYGRRYLLCLQTGIITDEDDDARGVNQAPRTTGQPATPEQAPVPPTDASHAPKSRKSWATNYPTALSGRSSRWRVGRPSPGSITSHEKTETRCSPT